MYQVTGIERAEWDAFQGEVRPHTFLQAWAWGEVLEQIGHTVHRLALRADGSLQGVALVYLIGARRGRFLFCPHGPVLAPGADPETAIVALAGEMRRLGSQAGCAFVRISPLLLDTLENQGTFKSLGFRPAPIHQHPELAWMLDLTPSEDDLLRGMRKTTRYLIRKTEKEGMVVRQSASPEAIAEFWPVYAATAARQHFTPFAQNYLRAEFTLFAQNDGARFFFAEHKGEVVAASVIIFCGDGAFYHHSGSLPHADKVNASYLLQWEVIKEAKRRGCHLYNFWGIAPDDRPGHPWVGLSLFKKGFGGFAEAYVHAQDKPLGVGYWGSWAVETLRRRRRGY